MTHDRGRDGARPPPCASRLEPGLFVAATILLAAIFVYLQIIRSVEPLALDQGLFACFGRQVPRGWLPYRDLFDSKPPLFLYTWAFAWSIGGSAASVWWFEAVWLAATVGLAYALAAQLWGRWAGLAAAAFLFVGLWTPGFGGYWSRAQAEELLVLPTLGAAWFAISAISRPARAVWVGVLVGVVGLYKIPALAVAGAFAALWLASLPPRDALRRIGWMAAGAAGPWLLAVGWFAAHGALGAFYEACFVYQRHIAAYIAPPWGNVLEQLPRTMARELGAVLLAAGAGLLVMTRANDPAERRRAIWLGVWIALTTGAVLAQRQLAGYHHLLIVPGLAFAAARGVSGLSATVANAGRPAIRAAAGAALLLIVVLGVRQLGDWRRAYAADAAHQSGRMSRAEYLRRHEVGIFSPAAEAEAARWLRAHTTPDQRILVWGLSPGIYALADRAPATRFPFHKLLYTDAPLSRAIPGLDARRAELMASMHADPPAYILIGTRDRNPFEPEDSVTSLTRFEELASFVGDYREETRIGRFVVLRRAPAP